MAGLTKTKLQLLLLIFVLSSCAEPERTTMRIATASNMQFVMEELIVLFERQTGQECEIILSSSGKLSAQIEAGADYDIFISADRKYLDALHQKGHGTEEPKIFANGELILWTMGDSPISPEKLTQQQLRHIAMANPKTAPYGAAAKKFLEDREIYEAVEDKLVLGESVAQTNQLIIFKAADAGFTGQSIVHSPKMKGKGKWIEIPGYQVEQGVLFLASDEERPAVTFFKFFLFSLKAQQILKEYGYSTVDSQLE